LRSHGLVRPEADKLIGLPESLVYADDTDFVSFVREYLDRLITVLGPLFREDFKLIVNDDKTENTLVGHSDMGADQKAWRNTKKLGSLLGVEEDVTRRIQLANVSLNKLEKLWKHRSLVALDVRLKAYRALVESVLLYNCGTWALSSLLADKIDRAQRKMLRRVLGVTWRDKITIENLYARCNVVPASVQVVNARWRLFGHVLRMNENVPARQAMYCYFNEKSHKGRQGNFCTIASVLSDEFKSVCLKSIKTKADYEAVVELAQDREQWKGIVQNVTQKYCESRREKVIKQREVRKKAGAKREEKK
jgi:hypothetical protein